MLVQFTSLLFIFLSGTQVFQVSFVALKKIVFRFCRLERLQYHNLNRYIRLTWERCEIITRYKPLMDYIQKRSNHIGGHNYQPLWEGKCIHILLCIAATLPVFFAAYRRCSTSLSALCLMFVTRLIHLSNCLNAVVSRQMAEFTSGI